ncbi:molybdopterin-binding protein [Amycolatopsis antarctica]|uniref:Molybdopterin-binding protein n=1 Tax=Amycolatopsis antarctica TaxID=1854586 RepID=A0A263D0U0_9PSEU|nr:molybdopterin-binding protein [Amycolatopsis antarctica]
MAVTGDVEGERTVTPADLRSHAHISFTVQYSTTHSRELHSVEGVPLHRVLDVLVLRRDERRKMDHLSFAVLACSADGYRVLLSWAEVSPEFGACAALLATRYNGELLRRPTLVLPNDARASRYVRDLSRLHVVRPNEG